MRAVILSGGLGARISEESAFKPMMKVMTIHSIDWVNDYKARLFYKGFFPRSTLPIAFCRGWMSTLISRPPT